MGPESERLAARTRVWSETHKIEGTGIDELRERAREAGIAIRVLAVDGIQHLCTADRRFNRINVDVTDGVVSRVDGLY